MTGLVECPRGCDTLIETDRLMCRDGTSRLPAEERTRVEAEHRRQREHVARHTSRPRGVNDITRSKSARITRHLPARGISKENPSGKPGREMYPTQPKPFRAWLKRERERIGVGDQELAERARLPVSLLRAIEAEVPELPSNSGQRARLVAALLEIEKERRFARLLGGREAL